MRRHVQQFVHAAFIVTLTLPIAAVAGLIILHVRGEHLLSVRSASMVPAFHPGDAVVVQQVSPSSLRPGDIVSYRSLFNPDVVVTHRLISLDRQTGQLITAGDALHSPDPPFSPLRVVGRATAVAPRLGTVLDTLRRPLGLAVMIYLPAALIVTAEAARLSRYYQRPMYLLDCRYAPKS